MSKLRKHLRNKILNTYPEPKENEKIVRVVGQRGTNQLEVEFPGSKEKILVMIPNKFQKIIWIKSGDYLLITFDRSSRNIGKIKGIVEYLLLKDQIKYLKKIGKWPEEFLNEEDLEKRKEEEEKKAKEKKEEDEEEEGEYEEEGEEEEEEEFQTYNPNRRYEESESEDEDESSSESDEDDEE